MAENMEGTLFNYYTREQGGSPNTSGTSGDANLNTTSVDKNEKAKLKRKLQQNEHHTSSKKRKLQTNTHYCLVCHETISRGNPRSRLRHRDAKHKDDPTYDFDKALLPLEHCEVIKEKRRLVAQKVHADARRASRGSVEDSDEGEKDESDEKEELETAVEGIELVENITEKINSRIGFDTLDQSPDAIPNPTCEFIPDIQDFETSVSSYNRKSSSPVRVQSVIGFQMEKMSKEKTDPVPLDDMKLINKKLDFLMEKLTISSSAGSTNEITQNNEAVHAVNILKIASTILEIDGSGISFYPGNVQALVRCDLCFQLQCEKNPQIASQDPFFLGHTNAVSAAGNTLALGLLVSSDHKIKYIEGHNDKWYKMKQTLLNHINCASSDNGGKQHYQAIIAKKRRDRKNDTISQVVSNQLKAALTTVKIKSASLHYEDLIALLNSCGANVGNLGHGRKQVNPMLKAFQSHLYKKLHHLLVTPLPSTGLPPHYSTSSDKSTPIRESNHAIMVLVMVDGKKTAIPISAPPVYNFSESEIVGGKANHLADQVISSLVKELKIPESSLSFLVAHQADGQYQAREFIARLKERIYSPHEVERVDLVNKFFVVPWDVAHWLDCCLTDIRTKEESGLIMRRLVKRVNKFHEMFGRGRGYAEYKGYTSEHDLPSFTTSSYSTTRFTSSSFETFTKVYSKYEGLIKSFNKMRESADEEEETRYMVKGRDFCIDLCGLIDILSPLMDMMVRVQAVHHFIWSVSKYWSKVRKQLVKAIEKLEEESLSLDPSFSPDIFPKLSKHFPKLKLESAFDCEFQGVTLTPGWMIVSNDVGNMGEKKFIWADRSPDDCINELKSFSQCLLHNMDIRYTNCVAPAAEILGKCLYIPEICLYAQGNSSTLSAVQLASLQQHGKDQFFDFFSYICTLPQIKLLLSQDPTKKFIPILSSSVYNSFKEVVVSVIWHNFGNCRSKWFVPIDSKYKHGENLSKFQVVKSDTELDCLFDFNYGNNDCRARFDEVAAIGTIYSNEEIYERLGKEMCITMDVAVAMSGSEAVVESYYSVMNTQTKSGGQVNDTLVLRTNVDWCFPIPSQCENTIKDVAQLYINGDRDLGLKPHQVPVFLDQKGRALSKYNHGGKVLDRLHKQPSTLYALSEMDKL